MHIVIEEQKITKPEAKFVTTSSSQSTILASGLYAPSITGKLFTCATDLYHGKGAPQLRDSKLLWALGTVFSLLSLSILITHQPAWKIRKHF